MIAKQAPRFMGYKGALTSGFLIIISLLLCGCSGGILDPKGQVGVDEKNLILFSTFIMLLVVIPVIFMTLFFALKYRAGHNQAEYDPKWSHSTKIELVVWIIPCIIILILGVVTWVSTHELDPYKPLEGKGDHLEVDVVSLDWKWLFIYPEQGIATVNELVIPAGVPVKFRLTSESVMNSFFIPQLGSQIYTMAAMETKLHLIADEPGVYQGYSANYSGAGFSGMKFDTTATPTMDDFNAWVGLVKNSHRSLSGQSYADLIKPSENDPVTHYASVEPGLFDDIVMKYMRHHGHTPLTDQTMSQHMQNTSGDHLPGHAVNQLTAAEE